MFMNFVMVFVFGVILDWMGCCKLSVVIGVFVSVGGFVFVVFFGDIVFFFIGIVIVGVG